MSTQAQSHSPFSRLSRLAFPFKATSPSTSPQPQGEDWYIPYNGPYEPPKSSGRNTDSWGHLVSGWLMENDGEMPMSGHGYGHGQVVSPRIRALSNASRTAADEQKRKSSRVQTSFIKLDQAGGIGDVPVPARPRRSQEAAPAHHRASFASILSLSKQKAAAVAAQRQLQHSSSVGTLRDRERGRASGDGQRARSHSNSNPHSHSHSRSNSNSIPHAQGVMGRPPQEGSSSSLPRSQPQALSPSASASAFASASASASVSAPAPGSGFSVRPHPYAYATPAVPPLSASTPHPVQPPPPARAKTPKFTVQLLEPLARKPSAPAYLLPASRPTRLSLKASMSTPNLRAATGTASVLPKGKQRWLSAETWCDALILPRPRFALRVMDADAGNGNGGGEGGSGSGSGRTVSPPPLPTWAPGEEPAMGKKQKTLKKSHSAVQLGSRPSAATSPSPPLSRPPPPVAVTVIARDDHARAGPSTSAQKQQSPPPPRGEAANADAHLKPYRPKSWAQDDLALPSPVPSLTKVLEDGRKLREDRKAWQEHAAKALDRRAGTFSRARSKSLGNRAAASQAHAHGRNPSAFEALTEATLLGHQKRRPTVHVRVKPPRSDGHVTSSGVGTNTITGTGTGTGLGTFTSTSQGQTKSQSQSRSQHGHSNSLGSTSQGPSEESFMWTPGHGRSRSFGKSALRVVRTTANTAAALCGKTTTVSPIEDAREKGLNEKAAAMEEALRQDGTKFIHLRDQVVREQGPRDNGIVVITPPPDSSNTQTSANTVHLNLSPSAPRGLSPTPSTSAEGVGIAISTPLPTPQPGDDVFSKEPIRIPAHPYAQGSGPHPYYQRTAQRTAGRTPIQTNVRPAESSPSPSGSVGGDSITRHRQAVKHPYSPYKPIQHPFAAITGTNSDAVPGPSTQQAAGGDQQQQQQLRPGKNPDTRPSPLSRMFAELSSGQIREIMPDEIQYSPFCPTPPIRLSELVAARPKLSSHPYGPPTNRTSEWGFADALNFTRDRRDSEDSGVGSSEGHEMPPVPIAPRPSDLQEGSLPFRRMLDDQDDTVVLSPEREDLGEDMGDDGVDTNPPSAAGSCPRTRTGISSRSNHTLASSMLENEHTPSSRHALPPHERSFNSSRSSPGLVSTQSSPPLSPHLFQSSDLQEFKDLFYKPENVTSTSTPPQERAPISRNQSLGSFQIDLNMSMNMRSTRSVSGLTTLARRLDQNAEEMPDEDGFDPMWEALHGAEAGRRLGDVGRERPEMVSKSSSGSGSGSGLGYRREGTQSPLRLPIDADLVLSQPVDVVPTDVESSRASSMLELPLEENPAHMRVGEIEAVSTPSVFAQPERFSTHLTEMEYDDTMLSPADSRRSVGTRIVSGESSLGVPFSSDAARSSFMTNTSGMSRLSDFPAPPSQITPSHMSILHAYYRDSERDSQGEEQESSRRGLVREPSHATFGGRQHMGEAL